MTVYLENTPTGEQRAIFRPYGESVSLAFVTLGVRDHPSYSVEFKAAACRDRGVWLYELDANNKLTNGIKP